MPGLPCARVVARPVVPHLTTPASRPPPRPTSPIHPPHTRPTIPAHVQITHHAPSSAATATPPTTPPNYRRCHRRAHRQLPTLPCTDIANYRATPADAARSRPHSRSPCAHSHARARTYSATRTAHRVATTAVHELDKCATAKSMGIPYLGARDTQRHDQRSRGAVRNGTERYGAVRSGTERYAAVRSGTAYRCVP